jgi:hypothetical protein
MCCSWKKIPEKETASVKASKAQALQRRQRAHTQARTNKTRTGNLSGVSALSLTAANHARAKTTALDVL